MAAQQLRRITNDSGESVSLMDAPNPEAGVIEKVDPGEDVELLGQDGSYLNINVRGIAGYVPNNAFDPPATEPEAGPTLKGQPQSAANTAQQSTASAQQQSPPAEPPQLLFSVADTQVSVALDAQAWRHDDGAFVVPTDLDFRLDGQTAQAMQSDLGGTAWRPIDNFSRNARAQGTAIDAAKPILEDVRGTTWPDTAYSQVIFATAYGADGEATRDSAGLAAVSVARLAADNRIGTVYLPLLGGGAAGVEAGEALAGILSDISVAAPFGRPLHLILVISNPELVSQAQSIARSFDLKFMTPGDIPARAVAFNDGRPRRDSLQVTEQARTFAKLLVAKQATMPIALGLFGNWGSGKSYFMDLLYDEIADLAGSQSDFVGRVAQIKFNAWHYVDSNLWASLAIHIFDGLAREFVVKPNEYEEVKGHLRSQLESSEQAAREAKARHEQAVTDRRAASLDLQRLRSKREEKANEFDKQKLKRLLKNTEVSAYVEHAKKAARDMGLAPVIETIEDVDKLRVQLDGLSGRIGGLLAAFGNRFSDGKKGAVTIAVIAVAVGAVAVGPSLLQEVFQWGDNAATGLIETGSQLSVAAGAVVAWAGRHLAAVSKGVGSLETVKARFDVMPLGEDEDEEEKNLRTQIELLDTEIVTVSEQLSAAEKQIAEAEEELQRVKSGGLIYDFVASQAADRKYTEKLGIISVIRRDFEKLEALLASWAADREGENAIERIVLYIDDLDRCHPDQVVAVLQAVHLLLAFDLFAVVVGVDPRWLERSLYKAYLPERLQANGKAAAAADTAEPDIGADFSPQNYLEKIFQIPYSLAAMSEDGYRRLMSDLAGPVDEVATEDGPGQGGGPADVGPTPPPNLPQDSGGKAIGPADQVAALQSIADGVSSAVGFTVNRIAGKIADQLRVMEENARALRLERWELDFIEALYPFVETPRLAKRMLNIYRLLRVEAAINSELGFDRFIDRAKGEYKAALILLALNIGYPDLAGKVLRLLEIPSLDVTWGEFWNALDPAQANVTASWARDVTLSDADKDAFRRVRDNLAELEKLAGIPVPWDLAPYKRWAPEVGRFSFHWHLS